MYIYIYIYIYLCISRFHPIFTDCLNFSGNHVQLCISNNNNVLNIIFLMKTPELCLHFV